ncbi:uncharacterized protein LOC113357956 [Papaver somniferum]|uniref:uncharacterized protein LOC113357956 n=1 Tax=Papaver somniferum TaxID=3469 RepID=UPI000E705695|nr:uncharacterized protein LOC113357956 [Papaver somniferum]
MEFYAKGLQAELIFIQLCFSALPGKAACHETCALKDRYCYMLRDTNTLGLTKFVIGEISLGVLAKTNLMDKGTDSIDHMLRWSRKNTARKQLTGATLSSLTTKLRWI